jgi:hypothetical protein
VPNLSDPDILGDLIDQTWTLYQQAQNAAQRDLLAEQFKDLSAQLGAIADSVPDETKQVYKDAVARVQTATQTVKQAQADQAKIAAAIGEVAQVIDALAKLAAMAAV